MSWEKSVKTPEVVEPVEESKDEPKQEEPQEDVKASEEAPKEGEKSPEVSEEKSDDKMVSQDVVGKVAKSIREKGRQELSLSEQRNETLQRENEELKARIAQQEEGYNDFEDDDEPKRPEDLRKMVRQEATAIFMDRQDALGRQKYGKDAYNNALTVIASQNDQSLVDRIWGAPNPADAAMIEAQRIAEDMQYGNDPVERERKKQEALEAKIRKKVAEEFQQKMGAQKNQPTDVSGVRAAGGDDKPKPVRASWATTLPK